jgi:DNA repair protein RecN (Recombination protein N)
VAQVFAITHQPQVAGKAFHHLLVSKHSSEGNTVSSAELLSPKARIEELARMISGRSITKESRRAAAGLMEPRA